MPENLFNIISGMPPKNIVDQILKYKNYDLVSFTGGISIGKYIAKKMVNSGNELKKYIPELGGNAVFVVMDDCDIDLAAQLSLGAFENSGQRCTAIRRILLHKDIYDDFIERFIQLTSQIKYGDPLNPENDMGTVRGLKKLTGNPNIYFGIPDVITSNTAPSELLDDDPLMVVTEKGVLVLEKGSYILPNEII